MNPFWNADRYEPGELVLVKDTLGVPSLDNPTGNSAKVYDDNFRVVGFIKAGTRLVLVNRPESVIRGQQRMLMYVEVIAPIFGRVWVQASHISKA